MLGSLIVAILSENMDVASAGGLVLPLRTYLVAFGYCNGKRSAAILQFHYCTSGNLATQSVLT